ncbi:MAG: Divalent metal cation transporter MntH [Opitutia bacterium UBA7350]|nr:MAG: Divalent metal cation transporter MntH [Opitutae bacterium UBA7350]
MEKNPTDTANLRKAIGPGLLVACAAIGGSHLVWSTRAGAEFGWALLGLILAANLLKMPFFLYGQRYAAATGESLLAGYHRKSPAFVWIFLGINILTGTINIAAVSMLAGALFAGCGIALSVAHLTLGIIALCFFLILLGHYRVLDGIAKILILLLTIGTATAVTLALLNHPESTVNQTVSNPYTWVSFAFLISLLGWMPAPVDLSTWSSLWMFSREQQTGHAATVRETQFDFFLGYGMTTLLAVLFLALGALVFYGSGEVLATKGVAFSNQLVSLYTDTIGEWSRWLILGAAFATMFSTSLTCIDGYPRSLAAACTLVVPSQKHRLQNLRYFWLILCCTGAALIVKFCVENLLTLLSFAAIISFLTSPILATINWVVMRGGNVPAQYRPGLFLNVLSAAGLLFFLLMALGYIYMRFFT